VLFNARSHPRAGEVNALWMQLAMDEDKEFIVGEVRSVNMFVRKICSKGTLAVQFCLPDTIFFHATMSYYIITLNLARHNFIPCHD